MMLGEKYLYCVCVTKLITDADSKTLRFNVIIKNKKENQLFFSCRILCRNLPKPS